MSGRVTAAAVVTLFALLASAMVILNPISSIAAQPSYSILGTVTPKTLSDPDRSPVEVGMRFQTSRGGSVTALRYYRGPANVGPHSGRLWGPGGQVLGMATFTNETASGWQQASLAKPVVLTPGAAYTVSYSASHGAYSYETESLSPSRPHMTNALTATQGVYSYGTEMPSSVWRNSNYFVDVLFTPTLDTTPTPETTVTTPTTKPTPTTPTPTPTTGCSTFPDSSCTGWKHTGVTLRTAKLGDSGPGWRVERDTFYVTSSGAVIDSLNIPFCVKIMADNVTIKRSRIACSSYYAVNISDPPRYFSGFTMTDVELDGLRGLGVAGIAAMGSPQSTYTRLDVHGFGSSGPRLASGTTLQDSYIHGFVCAPGEHSAGTSANDGGNNIRVLRNNIDISTGKNGCASNAIGLYHDFGTYNGVQILGNLVNGGAYCIYTAQSLGSKNVRVEGNTFGREYYPNCGQYGPAAQVNVSVSGNTFLRNVWGGGSAATSAHKTGDPVR